MTLVEDLKWRGLIKDISSPELEEKLNQGGLTFYIGTDPTADSLHVGHLSSFLISKRLKDYGHNPILLVGGGTGLIGDPRPTAERDTIVKEELFRNTECLKNQVQRLFGLPFEKINVVPNGVNLNKFTGMDRDYSFRRKYAMDNEKIILFMGRLVYEKGVQNLIAAMPKILNSYHDAKLVIAGKGGMIDELRAEAHNLGIDNKVYFTGYLDSKAVQKMYKCADVAVFPSTYEPFGIVALESMLSGTPTVVSDVGGLNEIIEHGVDGMKSYAGNPNSIADSVLALLFDPQLCANISKNAKAKVKAQFNWNKIAQDTHYVYERAICQTEAEKQLKQMEQERQNKAVKAQNSEKEITKLLSFKKKHAYA